MLRTGLPHGSIFLTVTLSDVEWVIVVDNSVDNVAKDL
jgi:hypothetical protein